jgi:hypothetical protein
LSKVATLSGLKHGNRAQMDKSWYFINDRLCSLCRSIFSGQWDSCSNILQSGVDVHPGLFEWESPIRTLVQIPQPSKQHSGPLMSLQHHSVISMRQSAQQCPLCRILLTRFHFGDERDSIEETGVGFVTIFQGQETNLIVYYFGQPNDGSWEFLEMSVSLNIGRLSEEQKGSLQNLRGMSWHPLLLFQSLSSCRFPQCCSPSFGWASDQ